jgi:uncharacterized oligopeptide transporter (OPT) family protein
VKEHHTLKYPEGTACAAVLKAGDSAKERGRSATDAKVIFGGFAVGLLYKTANVALKGWKDVPEKIFGPPLKGGSMSVEVSPELLAWATSSGRASPRSCARGGVLSYLLLIPMIKFFGDPLGVPIAPGAIPIGEMAPTRSAARTSSTSARARSRRAG